MRGGDGAPLRIRSFARGQLLPGKRVPLLEGIGNGRRDSSRSHQIDDLPRGDISLRAAEEPLDPGDGDESLLGLENLLHVEPLLIPANQACGARERREEAERAAVGDGHRSHQRRPAVEYRRGEETGSGHEMDAAVVHEAEIARVVEVEIEIYVLGPDALLQNVLIENADAGQRTDSLPDGERRDAEKAVDMGHFLASKAVSFGAVSFGAAGYEAVSGEAVSFVSHPKVRPAENLDLGRPYLL